MPAMVMHRRLRMDVQAAVPVGGGEEERGGGSPLEDLIEIVAESDSKKPLRCPECEKSMRKDRYQQMIPVIVDRCKQCDRVWLDTGELHLLRRLYLELATSSDPQIVSMREKVAMVNMERHVQPTLAESVATDIADVASNMSLRALARMLLRS